MNIRKTTLDAVKKVNYRKSIKNLLLIWSEFLSSVSSLVVKKKAKNIFFSIKSLQY